ncbi:MAG: class I SAM-dependent methyltransferase [Proteobacteria bacterium]|nr:class I SAM-dependent methyltransferase [Pseudomonadota bacterium]
MSKIAWNSRGYKKFDAERAQEYTRIANEVFAPIYPVIADRIIERCAIEDGLCIDVGSGPANLAVAVTKRTRFVTYAMDFSSQISPMAKENIIAAGLTERITPIVGDVHRMPFQDDAATLVVSRGSMRFWKNKPTAFREIRRVLKPGGKGYVGGGAGSTELSEEIGRRMSAIDKGWDKRPKFKYRKNNIPYFEGVMAKAGFNRYEIINDDSGFWIYVEKER